MINGRDLFSLSPRCTSLSQTVHRLKNFQLRHQEYWCSRDARAELGPQQQAELWFVCKKKERKKSELMSLMNITGVDAGVTLQEVILVSILSAFEGQCPPSEPARPFLFTWRHRSRSSVFPLLSRQKKASELQTENRHDAEKSSLKCQTGFLLHLGINLKPVMKTSFFFNRWREGWVSPSFFSSFFCCTCRLSSAPPVSRERWTRRVKGDHKNTARACVCRPPFVYFPRKSRGKQWTHSGLPPFPAHD